MINSRVADRYKYSCEGTRWWLNPFCHLLAGWPGRWPNSRKPEPESFGENGLRTDVTAWVAAIGRDDNRPAEIHARAGEDIRSRSQVIIGGNRIISLGFALNTQAVYIESEKKAGQGSTAIAHVSDRHLLSRRHRSYTSVHPLRNPVQSL